MNAASSGESPKNSLAVPSFQPFDFNFLRLVCFTVVVSQSIFASIDNLFRSSVGLLVEDFKNYNDIGVDAINDPPGYIAVGDP